MTRIYNKKFYKTRRRELRSQMPSPETKLWNKLRSKQLGVKFRRQFSVGKYILDFYSPRIKLAIEVDGDSHYEEPQKLKDKIRDRNLASMNIKVLRFTNLEVSENLDEVAEAISLACKKRPPLHLPLTKGEKERG